MSSVAETCEAETYHNKEFDRHCATLIQRHFSKNIQSKHNLSAESMVWHFDGSNPDIGGTMACI